MSTLEGWQPKKWLAGFRLLPKSGIKTNVVPLWSCELEAGIWTFSPELRHKSRSYLSIKHLDCCEFGPWLTLVGVGIMQRKSNIILASGIGGGGVGSFWCWFLKEEHRPTTCWPSARTKCTTKTSAQEKRWKDTQEDLAAFLLAHDCTPYLAEMGWAPLGRLAITVLSSQHPTVHTDIPEWLRWRSLRESQAGSPPSATGPPWLTFLRSYPLAGLGSRASCVSWDRSNKHRGPAIAFMLLPRSAISSNAISWR